MNRLSKCLRIAGKLTKDMKQPYVLDIGCGDGVFLKKLGKELVTDRLYGIDKEKTQGVNLITLDIDRNPIPFGEGFFDFIFAGNMIDILPNPDQLLRDIERILNPNGVALLTFPSLDWVGNKIAFFLGYQPYGDRVSTKYNVGKFLIRPHKFKTTNNGMFHLFGRKAFKQLAEIYGFKVEFYSLLLQRFTICSIQKCQSLL